MIFVGEWWGGGSGADVCRDRELCTEVSWKSVDSALLASMACVDVVRIEVRAQLVVESVCLLL